MSGSADGTRDIGVEEEFLLVDSRTRQPAPRVLEVLDDAQRLAKSSVDPELHSAQIETATPPCSNLDELRNHLTSLRMATAEAAGSHGAMVVASGTYPGEMGEAGRAITPKPRYLAMPGVSGSLAEEHLISGCHVHISVTSPDEAIRALNRSRRWTPCLLAMAANSPFWEGRDTGFDSFRTEVWARWPMAGPTGSFADMAEYEDLLERLISSGIILDEAMAYWDIRPSRRFPTVEFRVTDVMMEVDDVVLVAALTRAVVEQSAHEPDRPLRSELLRASTWRAALQGLSGGLLDPADGTVWPAPEMLRRLVDWARPALERTGDLEEVSELLDRLLGRGTGAFRQRNAYRKRQSFDDVLELAEVG